jgi:hypothetical protein
MYIDNFYKVIYVAIPKTGTYSIHDYFQFNSGHPEPDIHHASYQEIISNNRELENYDAFAFVRNPWDKLVSVYFDFLKRGRQYSEKIRLEKPLLHEFSGFEDFCYQLPESAWFSNVFFRPQKEFVVTYNDHTIPTIGRFECLQPDFKRICAQLDIPYKPLSHKNKGNYSAKYREYYSDKTRDIIGDLYKEDVEEFGYEF